MPDERFALWEKFKQEHPHGSRLFGTVTMVRPFGVFVDLGGPFQGLLLVPYIARSPDTRLRFPEDYPAVGQRIEVMIRHYGDDIVPGEVGKIALTQDPSSLWVKRDGGDYTRVFGSTLNEFSKSLTKAIQSLPREKGDRLHAIRSNCFHAYGFEGTRERLNNKTVGEILAEFGNVDPPARVIAEGEKDGVRFRLTEPTSDERPSNDGA